MKTYRYDTINETELDILKEIGNIGAGNASTALAQMLDIRIKMCNPRVELMEITMLPELLGGAETLVVSILIRFSGDIEGMIMFLVKQSRAYQLLNELLKTERKQEDGFGELEQSAMKEIGNIVGAAYLNSLSTLTNLKINVSVPYFANDMAGAILSVPAIEFGKVGEKALLMQSDFGENDTFVNGYAILIPTEQSNEKILNSLGL